MEYDENDVEDQMETFKVVLVGETGVGKTSIICQFIDKIFQDDLQASTGGSFSSKSFKFENGKILKFDIWDTAGQEKYRSLTQMFYKDAGAAVLVYDITRQESFDELKNYWANQIKESASQDLIFVVAANKSDLIEKEEVDESIARKFAEDLNAIFCSTSAKESTGIDDLFIQIAKKHTGEDNFTIMKDDGEDSEKDGKESQMFHTSMKLSKEKSYSENKKKKCC